MNDRYPRDADEILAGPEAENATKPNLDEYVFDTLAPIAVIDHMVVDCEWRYRCDGDSAEELLDEIRRHHDAKHRSTKTAHNS